MLPKCGGGSALKKRVSSVILNVYQSTGIEKENGSRQSLENHAKLDEIRRHSNKKFEENDDLHRGLAFAEDYSRPTKQGDDQSMSGIMGISYNPFLDAEAGAAYMIFKVTELLKFRTEKIVELDMTERERPSLGLILEMVSEVVTVPRSYMKVELRLGDEDDILYTNLGSLWKLLRPS